MKSTILVVGVACLSLAAVAQSNEKKEQAPSTASVTSPRDAATGQASGKRMHKPITVTAEVGVDGTAKDTSVDKVSNKSAADDWQTKSSKTTSPQVKRVAAGDVNGDGAADTAATQGPRQTTGQSAAINNSHSNVKSPRDLATGQASGKQAQTAPAAKGHDADPATKK